MRSFLAIARAGTLSGAARALGVNHATMARRLADLEKTLGGKALFERARDGYGLTAAGLSALAEAEAMENAAEAFRRDALASDDMTGPVRISTTASLAERRLAGPLADIAIRYPGLEIELLAEDRNVSLARGEADIAVRSGRPTSGDALTRRIGRVDFRFYARPDYCAAIAPDQRRVIGFPQAETTTPVAAQLSILARGRQIALRCATYGGQAEAAAAGAGLALLPDFVAAGDNRLAIAEDEPEARWHQQIWLVTRRDVRRFARVCLIADRIAELFGSTS